MSPVGNRVEVMHGVNLDMLGRRDPAHYGTLTLAELERAVGGVRAASSGSRCASSRPTPRASSSSTSTGSPARADGILLNPGAWTHYSWAIHDALEIAGLPAVEVHLSEVDEREAWRRVSVVRDLVRRERQRPGGRGLPRGARAAGAGSSTDERRAARRAWPSWSPAEGLDGLIVERRGQPPLPDRLHRVERPGAGRPATGDRRFLTDFRYETQAAEQVAGEFAREIVTGELLDALAAACRPGGSASTTRRRASRRTRACASTRAEGVELVAAGGLVERLRAVKDGGEIERDPGRGQAGRRDLRLAPRARAWPAAASGTSRSRSSTRCAGCGARASRASRSIVASGRAGRAAAREPARGRDRARARS